MPPPRHTWIATARALAGIRAVAVGGAAWAVTRRAGLGISEATVASAAGQVAGLLHATRQAGVAPALPGGLPPVAATWQFTRTGGLALAEGDELDDGAGTRCRIGPRTALTLTETWEATRR